MHKAIAALYYPSWHAILPSRIRIGRRYARIERQRSDSTKSGVQTREPSFSRGHHRMSTYTFTCGRIITREWRRDRKNLCCMCSYWFECIINMSLSASNIIKRKEIQGKLPRREYKSNVFFVKSRNV